MGNLAKDQRQIFGSGTEKHADKYGVCLDSGPVHRRPRHTDHRLDEGGV